MSQSIIRYPAVATAANPAGLLRVLSVRFNPSVAMVANLVFVIYPTIFSVNTPKLIEVNPVCILIVSRTAPYAIPALIANPNTVTTLSTAPENPPIDLLTRTNVSFISVPNLVNKIFNFSISDFK